MELERLEIPAELSSLLKTAEGCQHIMTESITEALPPEITAHNSLALPSDIDSFPFSSFISKNFQEPNLPTPGQPLTKPLTHLDGASSQLALDINKVMFRLLGDLSLKSWQEQIMGTYLARQGQCHPALRNEIFCQLVTYLWNNTDEQQSHRGWALMAILLSAFTPTLTLQKPLLKFVSDHAPKGIASVCQHKLLEALQQSQPTASAVRAYPPTLLEWIAGWRCGRMALDVFTFSEERYSAEVKSWTTGEQFAEWILQTRGIEKPIRGWSVSLLSGDSWQDLVGSDFVLDLIGQTEDLGDPTPPGRYPITPYNMTSEDIPPPPGIQAPALAPPPGPAPSLPQRGDTRNPQSPGSLDGFLDHLFEPVLSSGPRDLEGARELNRRMKGGGGIGTQQGGYPMMYPGMMQMPNYQPAMGAMMPAPVPFIPAMPPMGGVPAMPAMMMPSQTQPVVPTISARELAAQQQSFINQQAMILAQQMTTQAITLSQEQQAQQQRLSQTSRPASQPASSIPTPKKPQNGVKKSLPTPKIEPQNSRELVETSEEIEEKVMQPSTFQQKRDYFQRIGQERIQLKKVKPPVKVPIPQEEIEQEEEEEEEEEIGATFAPPCPPPAVVKKPLTEKGGEDKTKSEDDAGAKAGDESKTDTKPGTEMRKESKEKRPGTVVRSSNPAPKRAEPSKEIRNIIRMYQSRPSPVPEPIQFSRKPQRTFVKKLDPKDEALAKLGLSSNYRPHSPPAPVPRKSSPPPVAPRPKPLAHSESFKEKQKPLLNLFVPVQSTTSIPQSPPPPPLSPTMSPAPESGPVLSMEDKHISTQLLQPSGSVSFSYASAPWRLFLRKEVFYPRENFSHPYCLRLLCEQILRDTFTESCIRISPDERNKMKEMLVDFQVGMDASSISEDSIKKRIVVAARDNWANYFSRIFPVSGESGSDVQFLAVSHRGLRLLKIVNNSTFLTDHFKTLCSYSFAEVLGVEAQGHGVLQLSLRNEKLILHTTQAQTIKSMVELFLNELKKDSNYVIALRSYVTDDRSLLSFRCGDIIKLMPMASLEPGWQFGSIGGRSGLFPSEMVKVAAVPDYLPIPMEQREGQRNSRRGETGSSPQNQSMKREHTGSHSESLEVTSSVNSTSADGTCTYTMWEYALNYFRPIQTSEGWLVVMEEHNARSLVQYSKVPIQNSLTNLIDEDMNHLAVENFLAVMEFMGDQPKKKDELYIPFEMLKLCRENNLKDEIYCQLIKQVTENHQQEHCIKGWYLLCLLTGYFLPSHTLMPYVIKYLQDAAPSQELAQKCQEHLQHTVKYGGRQQLPAVGEMQAFLKGQPARILSFHLPGGIDYRTNIETFTVAAEVLEEMCSQMGITEPQEMQEFAIFLIKEEGMLVRPLRHNEYLNNVVREKSVELHIRRLTWDTPLHYENEVYISTLYNQVHRDYLQGKLLVSTQPPHVEASIAPLVALQHLSRGTSNQSLEQDLLKYIPQTLQTQVNLVTLRKLVESELNALKGYSRTEAHVGFLETVRHLPLFGYTVYIVLRVSEAIDTPCLLGLNRQHLILVDSHSQEWFCSIALKDIKHLRKLSPLDEKELPGLEINYGSLDSPKTIWLELPQARELQYTLIFLMEYSSTST